MSESEHVIVTNRDVVAALPEDGSVVSEGALMEALGLSGKTGARYIVQRALWRAAGFCVRRSPRGRVVGYQRWIEREDAPGEGA